MRRRQISPEFWTDERVVGVSDGAKLAFVGLWNMADRAGRLEDRPLAIGFKIRPWAPTEMAGLLTELADIGLIVRYLAQGVAVIAVPNFEEHQNFHPKEMASKLPGQTQVDPSHHLGAGGQQPKAPKKKKPKALPAGEPKERKASQWEDAFELMQTLAATYASEHGITYEPEDVEPQQINALLKAAATSLDVTADDLVDLWQAKWLPNPWAQSRQPAYAMRAFLSPKMLPKLRDEWANEASDLLTYSQQVHA